MYQKEPICANLICFDLESLDAWLHELIEEAKAQAKEEEKAKRKAQVIEERAAGARTLRLELIQCGKEGCKCATGKGHGPYWG